VFFVKKVENVFFCKKWTFPQRRVHYVQYQYFFILHFTYLGGAYAPDAPLPTGLSQEGVVNPPYRDTTERIYRVRLIDVVLTPCRSGRPSAVLSGAPRANNLDAAPTNSGDLRVIKSRRDPIRHSRSLVYHEVRQDSPGSDLSRPNSTNYVTPKRNDHLIVSKKT